MKKNSGITLIALIITIIVMLILVGVSVTVALQGGLFERAEHAKNQTMSYKEEELEIDRAEKKFGRTTIDQWAAVSGVEEEVINFEENYTDAESYNAYAQSIGYTVLTMEEYDAAFAEVTYENNNGFAVRKVEYSYSYPSKIALPYGVTGDTNSWDRFGENSTITDVLIPNTMTLIEGSMFSDCDNLKSVYIPGSVKTINGYAFDGCTNLSRVEFGETFSGCYVEPESSILYNTPWLNARGGGSEPVIINGETYYFENCFVEGTKVLTAKGLVNIEDVNVGDKVISRNNDTGIAEEKSVLKVAKHEISYNTLKITVANSEIELTPNHRMYVKDVGYTRADNLKVGDILVNINNVELPIEKIEEVENTGIKRVYNFIVEDNHNYFVGIDSILVHNKCFVAGSKVLTPEGLVNIEDIKVGDYVLTYNEETGRNEAQKVTGTFIHEKVEDEVTIAFSDGSSVVMNMYHPIYTVEGWKSLSNFNGYEMLKVGDKVRKEEGYKEVVDIKVDLSSKPVDMYTISVENADNFIVNGTVAHDNEY